MRMRSVKSFLQIYLSPLIKITLINNFQSNNNKLNLMQKLQRGRPQHYSLDKGKLFLKSSLNEFNGHRVIKYRHIVRQTPDQYHINAIKQYKKQLDLMRKNYEQLKKAYYYLLGYRIQGSDLIPKSIIPKDNNNFLCVTQVSDCYERSSHLNSSQIDIVQAAEDIDQNKRKIARLTESIIEFGNKIINKSQKSQQKQGIFNKTKTQYDQSLEDQLFEAQRQIDRLKNALQRTHQLNQVETRQYKQNYQEHIRKLEQILERERRHTKMLNGVIGRLRNQLQLKDSFIKSIMKLKGSEKNAVQKILRQFKINNI